MNCVYNPSITKPKKSGVYAVRCTVHYVQTGEPAATTSGYAYWNNSLKRWAAIALTIDEAKARRYSAGWVFNADQGKEWAQL